MLSSYLNSAPLNICLPTVVETYFRFGEGNKASKGVDWMQR